jgi:hypothetical protein
MANGTEDNLTPSEFAAIGIAIDGLPIHTSPKLASVEPDQTEAYYLLATYCFDLQRKMQYLYRILNRLAHRVADQGLEDDRLREIARELLADEERLNGPGMTWRQRAEGMERRMIELHAAIEKDREELLKRFTGGNTGPSQST